MGLTSQHISRCVGAEFSSPNAFLNAKYLQNFRGGPMLMPSRLTEEQMDEVDANPLFDNRETR